MSLFTERSSDTHGDTLTTEGALYNLWKRLNVIHREGMSYAEFQRHWATLDAEDRDDLLYSLEQSEKMYRGEDEAIPLEDEFPELAL